MSAVLPEGFTTEIRALGGYDYRDDPTDGRGCASLRFAFNLRGPLGAITWDFFTGIMHRPVDDLSWGGYQSERGPRRSNRPGFDRTRFGHPTLTAGGITSHSPEAHRDWWRGPDECDVLAGERCYNDTGYMVGDQAMNALLTGGEDALWAFLVTLHDEWLGPEPEADTAEDPS